MPYILALEDINRSTKAVGNKAANLGEMIKSGLPIPTGFAITSDAFDFFLKFNRLEEKVQQIFKEIDPDNTDQLKQKSKEIEDLITSGDMPEAVKREVRESYENIGVGKEARLLGGAALDIIKAGRDRVFVAVRSSALIEDSATASFAGQMRTYVNINGTDKLFEAIKRCWASLFTPRAIFYRKRKNLEGLLTTGVIVQKMLEPEKSGILFTADPVKSDRTKLLIEASYGLGQSVASGFVIPDRYYIEKGTGQLSEKKIGKKTILFRKDQIGKTIIENASPEKASSQVLLDPEISKLFDISRRIETLYGNQPQDIEWCIERGRIFVLQSRPITALKDQEQTLQPDTEKSCILNGSTASLGKTSGKIKLITTTDSASKIIGGDIIAAKTTNPNFVPYLGKAVGVITDEGGVTNHFAIVCREFGIPFIAGTEKATQLLFDNQDVHIDGYSGSIFLNEEKDESPVQQPAPAQQFPNPKETQKADELTATEINLNLRLSEEIENISPIADSIAPLSIEHILMDSGKNPIVLAKTNPHELLSIIIEKAGKVAAAVNPKPVWYKCLEIRTEEFQPPDGEEEVKELNPLLGKRGIRASIANQDILKIELKALKLLKENGIQNINLLLPFVTIPEEIISVKTLIDFPMKIGIVAETPATVIDLERICRAGVDFVLIGLNNLSQLALGVDRSNPSISHLYSENHPAVLTLIKKAIQISKSLGIKSSVYGDGVSSPGLIEKLIEFGVNSISVEPLSIGSVRTAIIRTERRLMLDKIRKSEKGL